MSTATRCATSRCSRSWTRPSPPAGSGGCTFRSTCTARPGYIITGWETEPYNLWTDRPAREAFVATWARFARRPTSRREDLSFDLVNEPPALGLRGFTRDAHEAVIRPAVGAVRALSPDRPLVIDGLDGGNLAMPELADLGLTQSVRGYQPMSVSALPGALVARAPRASGAGLPVRLRRPMVGQGRPAGVLRPVA